MNILPISARSFDTSSRTTATPSAGATAVASDAPEETANLLGDIEAALAETRRKIVQDRLERAQEEMRILRQFSVSPSFLAFRSAAIGRELGAAATDFADLMRDQQKSASNGNGPVENPNPGIAQPPQTTLPLAFSEEDEETVNGFRSAILQAWALLDISMGDLMAANDHQPSDEHMASHSRNDMKDGLEALNALAGPALALRGVFFL
ncbi:hypothetical protein FE840_015830 [Peteryoungia desertarenae]|uniref:Uncharacterized protein n=1 Tax=Peteryoungia desertarenae TaxID=1813451 RepID=A0ABX6QQM8_9HYPH|nr:hypothetical protein [Peteryoungia desertarenae]QLF70896.1 hypothetical protein FE840_015830 [Peteryoungia desertarenae]